MAIATREALERAGRVLSIVVTIGATSAARATALSPTTGKRVRIVSVQVTSHGLTTDPDAVSVYFHTGSDFTSDTSKIIAVFAPGTSGAQDMTWGDGSGPRGDVDEVVSWRTETETETALHLVISYREE